MTDLAIPAVPLPGSSSPAEPGLAAWPQSNATPVTVGAPSQRLPELDFVRGLALLGITIVNTFSYFVPALAVVTPATIGPADWATWWTSVIFCEGKFRPLLALLFGMGMASRSDSTAREGHSFVWTSLRRLLALAILGIAHISFLWHGDILLFYSILGCGTLWFMRRSARTLFWATAIIGLCTILPYLVIGWGEAMFASDHTPAVTPQSLAWSPDEVTLQPDRPLIEQFVDLLTPDQPSDVRFVWRSAELERKIHVHGPFRLVAELRMYIFLLQFTEWYDLLRFGAEAACFCFGAALLKSGFLRGEHPHWEHRLVWLGLLLGLPLQVLAGAFGRAVVVAPPGTQSPYVWMALLVASEQLQMLTGPLVSLMYLVVLRRFALSGRVPGLVHAVTLLGRMSLTGYLALSFLMVFLADFWGLGWFGSLRWQAHAWIALGGWAIVLLFANLWLRWFRLGPLEWFVRSFSYWRLEPLWASTSPAPAPLPQSTSHPGDVIATSREPAPAPLAAPGTPSASEIQSAP